MRKRWVLSGLSPKGKTFKAEVIADSEAGARTQTVLALGNGTQVIGVVGPFASSQNEKRYGHSPCIFC